MRGSVLSEFIRSEELCNPYAGLASPIGEKRLLTLKKRSLNALFGKTILVLDDRQRFVRARSLRQSGMENSSALVANPFHILE
jgi:hypothetical protein